MSVKAEHYDVIRKPIITEKMTDLSEKFNRYGFIVEKITIVQIE